MNDYTNDKYLTELVDFENAEWIRIDDEYAYCEVWLSGATYKITAEYCENEYGEYEYSIIDTEYVDDKPRH